MTYTIVITTKNRQNCLNKLLTDIGNQSSYPQEIIIVDDSSISPIYVPPHFKYTKCKLIRNRVSKGCIASRNLAFNHSTGEFVFCIDDDVRIPHKKLFEEALHYFSIIPQAGAIAFSQQKQNGSWYKTQPANKNSMAFIQTFYGYCWGIRRNIFLQCKGFLEYFEYGYEETEFCLRMLAIGHKVLWHPMLHVIHLKESQGRESRSYLVLRNKLYTIFLHSPLYMIIPLSLKAILRYSGGLWLGDRHWMENANHMDIPKAILDFVLHIKFLWEKRKPVCLSVMLKFSQLEKNPEVISKATFNMPKIQLSSIQKHS